MKKLVINKQEIAVKIKKQRSSKSLFNWYLQDFIPKRNYKIEFQRNN